MILSAENCFHRLLYLAAMLLGNAKNKTSASKLTTLSISSALYFNSLLENSGTISQIFLPLYSLE